MEKDLKATLERIASEASEFKTDDLKAIATTCVKRGAKALIEGDLNTFISCGAIHGIVEREIKTRG